MKQLNVTLIFPSLIWPGAVISADEWHAVLLTYKISFPLFPDCERQRLKTFFGEGCCDCFAELTKQISFQVEQGTKSLIER